MIDLQRVKKRFSPDERWVSNGVSFTIPQGKSACIMGASGEGKSVLLKQIAGLIRPTSGTIIVDGKDITSLNDEQLELFIQNVGYVFQFAALLDSLNIFENIGLALLEKNTPKEEVLEEVEKWLKEVKLKEDILTKFPSEISGGMKKRVGLARTLISQPKTILYDEPTSGLDPITTRVVHELMRETQQKFNISSLIISHDIEIFNYTDYVIFLYGGKVEYFGPANTIWEADNQYVYQFIRGLPQGPIK